MANLTIQVMDNPKSTQQGAYKRFDIVDIYMSDQTPGPPSPNCRMNFIRVTGAPKSVITDMVSNENGIHFSNPDESREVSRGIPERRSAWCIHFDELADNKLAEINDNKETTITWAQLKQIMRRFKDNKILQNEDILWRPSKDS